VTNHDHDSSASSEAVAGRRYDAALHLLDRQVVDPDGRLVAKVDDLELTQRDDHRLAVTAILTGPGALGPRLGDRLGQWVVAIWRRLRADTDPQPGRIDATHIAEVDSVVHIAVRAGELHINGLEAWVNQQVVTKLPGATHEPD
jgi:hypothetical protein